MEKFLKQSEKTNSILIFDLEDTLYDIEEKQSPEIKKWGRAELLLLSQAQPYLFLKKKIGIRFNSPQSPEFADDLVMTEKLQKQWPLEMIVLPKIESRADVQKAFRALKEQKIAWKSSVLIVETIEGMNNLSSIAKEPGVEGVIYGHNDYSLQRKSWPFLEHTEPDFWSLVTPFIQSVEQAKVQYIHPPLPYLAHHRDVFAQVLSLLKQKCKSSFGIMAVNSDQAALIQDLENKPLQEPLPLKALTYSLEEKIGMAQQIQTLFLKKKSRFCIDARNNTCITPHLYRAALSFLEGSIA